jgi:hypothetical protein
MKRNKFIDTSITELNRQPHYNVTHNIDALDDASFTNKNKTRLQLKETLDPYDYELNYFNRQVKDVKGENEYIYYSAYDQGPGRGFGNLNTSNQIRLGQSSRETTEDFRIYRESEIINRFEFIDNRYVNPNNLVFPLPRSGENTRKVNNITDVDLPKNNSRKPDNFDLKQDNYELLDFNNTENNFLNNGNAPQNNRNLDSYQIRQNLNSNGQYINSSSQNNNSTSENKPKFNYDIKK